MSPELIILLSVLGAFVIFVCVLVLRALTYKPHALAEVKPESVFINKERAVETLAELIRCKTVSDRNKENECEAEFDKFKEILPKLFPNVFNVCNAEYVGDRAILVKWSGKSSDSPTVLMSHYDVVSVIEEDWQKPAFEGITENGVLWGRGTLDTKGTLNGILSAAETLISSGFVPERDIYFAFGGDEEINGHGANDIVNLFIERKITPGLVVDEGGAVVDGVFPGVKRPAALIGIAEKGMINVEYSVKGGGGHASSPAPHTPVGRLSLACVKMEKTPFKYKLTKPARLMLDTLGRHSTFVYRLIFANLWCFSPILNLLTRLTGGELNALVRTTTAFTQMEGSKGINVIPPKASMASNHRILPGETADGTLLRIRKVVDDDKITVSKIDGMDPSVVSDTDCEAWYRIYAAVSETWTDAIVSPYLMLACSDSRHWGVISDKVYRFSAMSLSKEQRATIHGNDERIPFDTVARTVEFYVRLMKKS